MLEWLDQDRIELVTVFIGIPGAIWAIIRIIIFLGRRGVWESISQFLGALILFVFGVSMGLFLFFIATEHIRQSEPVTSQNNSTNPRPTRQWEVGDTFRECDDCPLMVVVGGGAFLMGSPASHPGGFDTERPAHRVTVSRFAIGRYEVTEAEWDACVRSSRCTPRGRRSDRYPVTDIWWDDTQDYVLWLNQRVGRDVYRLPTEAEWEFAARGGSGTQYFWGDSVHNGCQYANLWDRRGYSGPSAIRYANCSDNFRGMAPVGSFRPNQFGLYDVTGNAWEWVQDCFEQNVGYVGASNTAEAREWRDCPRRVLRGGSYDTFARSQRTAFRGRLDDGFSMGLPNGWSFRIARTMPD